MPLIDSTLATLRADIAAGPHELFVVLTSATSETSGKPWCPYCVLAEPAIQRVFGDGDKYALIIRYAPQDITSPANWLLDDWHMVGVPMIFRVVGGTPGVPTSYEKDFDAELDAYVTSPNDWEQQVRIREGDKYKPLAERVADSEAEFEGFRAQIEAYRTKIKAETEKDGNAHEEKVKEEGGKTKLCTGDSCAL